MFIFLIVVIICAMVLTSYFQSKVTYLVRSNAVMQKKLDHLLLDSGRNFDSYPSSVSLHAFLINVNTEKLNESEICYKISEEFGCSFEASQLALKKMKLSN